jgi:hypothetical protein
VEGGDQAVYHKASINGGAWSAAWDNAPNGIVTATPVALSDGDGIAIVVIGPGGTLNYNKYTFSTATWSTIWSSMGFANSPPSATRDSSGTIHVVIRDLDNNVKYISRPSGGQFTGAGYGYTQLGGVAAGRPAVSVTGTTVVALVRGQDNAIYSNISANSGSTWSGWTAVPGGTSPSDPSIAYQ